MSQPKKLAPAPSIPVVLRVPELFEMILLQVDIRTLVTSAHAIDKQWYAFIQTSKRIQQELFFHPDENAEFRANDLLAQYFPWCFYHARDNFGRQTPATEWTVMTRRDENLKHASSLIADTEKLKRNFFALARSGASWRRMLVCQPPKHFLPAVCVAMSIPSSVGPVRRDTMLAFGPEALVEPTPALTMEMLFETFLDSFEPELSQPWPEISIRVLWHKLAPLPGDPSTLQLLQQRGTLRVMHPNSICIEIQGRVEYPTIAKTDWMFLRAVLDTWSQFASEMKDFSISAGLLRRYWSRLDHDD